MLPQFRQLLRVVTLSYELFEDLDGVLRRYVNLGILLPHTTQSRLYCMSRRGGRGHGSMFVVGTRRGWTRDTRSGHRGLISIAVDRRW